MRFRFEIPTEAAARELLDWRRRDSMYQDEMYKDAIECQRRLLEVTTPEERAEAKRMRDINNSTGESR